MLKPFALALGLAAFAAPAWAQKDDIAGIDSAYDSRAMACLEANQNQNSMTPQARLEACQADLSATESYYATRFNAGAHEINIYYFHRAFLLLEMGGAYLKMDGTRSARVCTQTEASWATISKIRDSESPSSYQENYTAMRGGIRGAIEACRRDFGTPAGAPPL